MKRFRTVLFWLHLSAGAFAAAVVVVMSTTGVLLTYQKQITAWADRRVVNAKPPTTGSARLGVNALLERAAAQAGATPSAITVRSRADAPAEVAFGRER